MPKSKVTPIDLTLNIENDICSICIDKLDYNKKIKIKTLDCNHKFHSPCIIPWININNNCPLCRKEITTTTPNTPNTQRRQYIYHHNEEQEIIRPPTRQRNKTKCSLLMLFCLVVCVSVNLIYFHNLSITYIEHINIKNKNNTNITTPQPNLNNLTNNSTNQNNNQSTNIYNYSSITFLLLYFSFYGICQLFCIYKYYIVNKQTHIALFISSSILMILIPLYYIFDITNTLGKIDNNESKPNLDTQINMNYKTSSVMFYCVLLIYIIQYLYISSK
jgi:hypothetical protein